MTVSELGFALGYRRMPPSRSHRGQRRIMGFGLAWAVLAAATATAETGASGASATPPPAVEVAAVVSEPVDRAQQFIGTIEAIESVDLKARVEGYLEQVAFDQGSMVDKGQLLYQIEQAPYQADLDSAEGQLAAARADLDGARASLEDKEADFQRQAALIKKGDTSQTAFDQAKAARDEAKASVEQSQANVTQAEASLATANINLGYTTIDSPIAGRIGATAVTVGNLVNSTSGTLATVVQLDPIRAVFSIPSAERVRFIATTGGDTDAAREMFEPRLILPTGEEYAHPGRIAFGDNQVDASTGTVAVYADFPNPDELLLPGQFIQAVLHESKAKRLPTIPAAAIQRTRDGEQVYLVGTDNRVELRRIGETTRVGNQVAVGKGLREGEIVVVSGIQKIKPGVVVSVTKASAVVGDGGSSAEPSAPETTASSGDAQDSDRTGSDGRERDKTDPDGDAGGDSDADADSDTDTGTDSDKATTTDGSDQ